MKISFSRNHDGAALVLIDGKPVAMAHECDGWAEAVALSGKHAVPDDFRDVFAAVIRELENNRFGGHNGNAPGHAHDIPGVWDSDNGALAGQPCAWCALWNKAKAMLADAPTPPVVPAADAYDHALHEAWMASLKRKLKDYRAADDGKDVREAWTDLLAHVEAQPLSMMTTPEADHGRTVVPEGWENELLDLVSACQSAYFIETTPGHRFAHLANLDENRRGLVDYVRSLLTAAPTPGGAE